MTLFTPADWRGPVRCGVPQGNVVYAYDDAQFPCAATGVPPERPPGITSVTFRYLPSNKGNGPVSVLTVDGRTVQRTDVIGNPTENGVLTKYATKLTVPSLRAGAFIESDDRLLIDKIVSTMRLQAYDASGCAQLRPDLANLADPGGTLPVGRNPVRAGADEMLIPGDPTSITVCRYQNSRSELQGDWTLDESARATLIRAVNALPEGLSVWDLSAGRPIDCMDSVGIWTIKATYPDGPPVEVIVRFTYCGDLGASNGTRTGQLTQSLISAMKPYSPRQPTWMFPKRWIPK